MAVIYIGIISRQKGHWAMFTSLINNMANLGKDGHNCLIDPHVGDSLVSRARNEVQSKFLKSKADYYLQMDDDISMPPHAISTLIEADKDIVGGAYRLKSQDKEPKAALRAYKSFSIGDHPNQLIKLKYLSTGCFMQKRATVEKMVDAYKDLRYIANGVEVKDNPERFATYMPFIYDGEYLSEDWAYCQRALDIGLEVYLHTGVLCGHWGLHNYDFEIPDK
jgi:hypothetical protein